MSDTVLVVSPHRDDETIGCGGTLCKHADRGDRVFVVHLCGEQGGSEQEAEAAARELGIERLFTLSASPVQLEASQQLLLELVTVIRTVRPSILYVPHASDDDPTHRVAAKLAHEARWVSSTPVFPAAGAPVSGPTHVYAYEVWQPLARPAIFVDVTDQLERKVRALRAYESQLRETAWDDAVTGLNRYRGVTSGRGEYVEAFALVRGEHL